MGTGGTALRNIEELNQRADSAAGGADAAEWENLRADYSWALEEARRVLEVSESLRAFECWITIHIVLAPRAGFHVCTVCTFHKKVDWAVLQLFNKFNL